MSNAERERPAPVCAWCPGFDPTRPANKGQSHGMCPTCSARLLDEVARRGLRRLVDGDPRPDRDDEPRPQSSGAAKPPRQEEPSMTIKITPNEKGNPPGKLGDAELHFSDGPLAGLKLIGFSIWERRSGAGRNVTFPARSYSVNGERRSFALLRPIVDATAQHAIRDAILEAFAGDAE